MDEPRQQTTELIGIATAVFGGLAKQMHDWLTRKKDFLWQHLVARAIVSAFVGLLFYYVAQKVNSEWTYIACSLSGWLGADGVSYVLNRFSPVGEPRNSPTK